MINIGISAFAHIHMCISGDHAGMPVGVYMYICTDYIYVSPPCIFTHLCNTLNA